MVAGIGVDEFGEAGCMTAFLEVAVVADGGEEVVAGFWVEFVSYAVEVRKG